MPTSNPPFGRVFIAATYDLERERQAAAEAILKAGGIPVGIEWWRPPNAIGPAVLNSDLLLMIVGNRPGSISPINISYLEYEYLLARRAGIPVAAITLHGQFTERLPWFFERFTPDFKKPIENIEMLPQAITAVLEEAREAPRRSSQRLDGVLRIFGGTSSAASDIGHWIVNLDHAYCGIFTFFQKIDDAFLSLQPDLLRASTKLPVEQFLAPSERLRFHRAAFASDGSWDFLGQLNPLEVIRKYLNDRHERRKDREYRESAERRRLDLENELLETKVIAEKLKVARDMGVAQRDIAATVNTKILIPLRRLDALQDEGAIHNAELIEPPLLEGHSDGDDHS